MSEAKTERQSGRILVVDDSTANLQLLTNLLTSHGYTVHPASDGELALEFVRSTLPALILLDIRLPGIDGFEVCRRLKADERTRSIPIIFISALENERDKVKGFQAGAVDYITKPFQPEEVLARVSIHLRLQKLTVRLEQEVCDRTEELAAANQLLQQELAERQKAEALLRQNEERYRLVFENSPVSIWEEDFSLVKALFDDLKSQGVSDIEAYFDQYPEMLRHCAESAKIVDVNQAALSLHGATTKKELLAGLVYTFTPESFATFRRELVCLWNQETDMTVDAVVKTLRGDQRNVTIYFSVCPGYEETFSKVIVSLIDITERKQAREQIAWNLAINQALSSLYIPLVTAGADIERIANIVLERCRQLTSSPHGFVSEIDPATGDQIAHTLTGMMYECKLAKEALRKIKFPQRADGLYNGLAGHALNTREPFYTDTPVKHPASVGIPDGHLVIERFLAVPVLLTGELVGQIALSNSTRA